MDIFIIAVKVKYVVELFTFFIMVDGMLWHKLGNM